MAFNETKLDKKMPKNLLDIKTYKFEREDRNRHCGGVAVYIRDSIKYIRCADVPINDLELFCMEVQPVKAFPFLVTAWYRPPSEPVASFEKFEQALQYLENEDKEISFSCGKRAPYTTDRIPLLLIMGTREQHVPWSKKEF